MKKQLLTICLVLLSMMAGNLFAQSAKLSIQGVLRNSNGTAVENGHYRLSFKLWDSPTGGTLIWAENIDSVRVEGGIYSVVLGQRDKVLDAPFDEPYFLGVAIEGGAELIPRASLTSSPYALSLIGSDNVFPNSGNVGIGANQPMYKLTVQRADGVLGLDADDHAPASVIRSKDIGLRFETEGDAFVFGQAPDKEAMRINTNGNIGIGTDNPDNKLHVNGEGELIKVEGETSANIAFYKTATNAAAGGTLGFIPNFGNALVLDNTIGQTHVKGTSVILSPSSGNTQIISDAQIDGALSIVQQGETLKLKGTNAAYIGFYPEGTGNRKAYIGFSTDTNDDLLLKNEATNANIEINTTGTGEVKMNAFLKVSGSKSKEIGYHRVYDDNFVGAAVSGTHSRTFSIWAEQSIRAIAFLGDSDRRIKKDFKISNGKNDLDVLNQIQVTDYRHIDPTLSGTESIKGFIAQQVKAVYPEAVKETPGVIPSVFAFPASISKNGNTTTFTMAEPHHLTTGSQIQILSNDIKKTYKVIGVPNARCFILDNWDGTDKAKEIFVYGEAISDFNVIDYDRVFTLSVSAVQELSKKVETLEKENLRLKDNSTNTKQANLDLRAELEDMNKRLESIENLFESTSNK